MHVLHVSGAEGNARPPPPPANAAKLAWDVDNLEIFENLKYINTLTCDN